MRPSPFQMQIRHRIALVQLPALGALILFWLLAQEAIARLSASSDRILAENYRSVLAAQRMKEAAERMDSAALFRIARPGSAAPPGDPEAPGGEPGGALAASLLQTWRPVFEAELQVEASNVTEPGEQAAVDALTRRWAEYGARYDAFLAVPSASQADFYFGQLYPVFLLLKADADAILTINQDAMLSKRDMAAAEAIRLQRAGRITAAVGLIAAALAGLWAGRQLSGPWQRLSDAAGRVAEDDLTPVLQEEGDLESIQVARAFNRMLTRLRAYRRASEHEVVRARDAAQAAINSLPDPVLVLAPGGELRLANRAAARIGIAASARSLAGITGELRGPIRAMVQEVERSGMPRQPEGYEEALIVEEAGAGAEVWLPCAVPMLEPGGRLVGVTVLLQDITRFRRLDQLKDDLVNTVAHELRTPLTSLGMALHLALDARVSGSLPDPLSGLLSAAREDVRRLKTLVADLLDLSRIQEGRIALNRAMFPARALIADACEAHAAAAAARDVRLQPTEPAPDCSDISDISDISVYGDRARLAVALGNLVANAIKAAPTGSTVHLSAVYIPAPAHAPAHVPTAAPAAVIHPELLPAVQFRVDDSGAGVPEADRARILDRFERGHSAGQGADSGAGLGLYIAREILAAHGGQVGVGTSPQGGARAWLLLPVAEADAAGAAPAAEDPA